MNAGDLNGVWARAAERLAAAGVGSNSIARHDTDCA